MKKKSIKFYVLAFLFLSLLIFTATYDDLESLAAERTSEPEFENLRDKTFCLKNDMWINEYESGYHDKFHKYRIEFNRPKHPQYPDQEPVASEYTPKGVRVKIKETWQYIDEELESICCGYEVLAEVQDGKNRNFLVNIGELLESIYWSRIPPFKVSKDLMGNCPE